MSAFFPKIVKKRYANFARRYANDYFFDSRRAIDNPDKTIGYATLTSARRRATESIDQYECTTVRIFDRRIGQYVYTYKDSVHGIIRHEGCVR